jgi:serine protease Do
MKQDTRRDLALLAAENLSAPPVAFAGRDPQPGAPVIAVGNPFGFVGAVSTGSVHRIGSIRGLGDRRWIQSDLRLAPGNSGGPLADIHGQILGINTMIAGPFALAIPIATVQAFLSGAPPRSLGVTVKPVLVRRTGMQPRFGLVLLELGAGGPAEKASLLPGDVLVSAADKQLASPEDLYDAIASSELLTLGFTRSGSPQERKVVVQLEASQAVHAA